jgi:hypothetical protein
LWSLHSGAGGQATNGLLGTKNTSENWGQIPKIGVRSRFILSLRAERGNLWIASFLAMTAPMSLRAERGNLWIVSFLAMTAPMSLRAKRGNLWIASFLAMTASMSLRGKRGNPWIASCLAMTVGMDRFVPRDDGGDGLLRSSQ